MRSDEICLFNPIKTDVKCYLELISDIDTNVERFVSLANIGERKICNQPALRTL